MYAGTRSLILLLGLLAWLLCACSTALAPTVDAAGAADTAPDSAAPIGPAPDQPGPFLVGTRAFYWVDTARNRKVPTQVWYPCQAGGQPVQYLELLQGKALADAPVNAAAGTRPIVLFSHGFQGINAQSFTIVEHIASHGYVVVAPNHEGNTFFDFDAKDQDIAQVSLQRPKDIAFALAQVQQEADLQPVLDATRIAMTGHSFGGWTALVVAGAVGDADAAKAACAAGAPSQIMCKYIAFFDTGAKLSLQPPLPGLRCAVMYTPGGFSSLGDAGLAQVGVPGLVFGGTLDDMTSLAAEITPIYAALPEPKALAVIQHANHHSFTDICSLPIAGGTALKPYCGTPGVLPAAEVAHVAASLTVAWLRRWLQDDKAMTAWLDAVAVQQRLGNLTFSTKGL